MAIIDNPVAVSGGEVDQTSALQWMLNNKTDYSGIAAGLTTLTELPTFTQPSAAATARSYTAAFKNCRALAAVTGIDVGQSSSSSVSLTGAAEMFYNCQALTTVPSFTNCDVSRECVGGSKAMFYNCQKLTTLDLKTSFIGSAESGYQTFYGCSSLTTINSQNTIMAPSFATDLRQMFYGCSKLTNVTLTNTMGDRGALAVANQMFYGCSEITAIQIPGTSYLANAEQMFYGCSKLTSLLPATLWLPNVKTVMGMFWNCKSLTSVTIENSTSPTDECRDFRYMFYGCTNLTTVSKFSMSACTNPTYYRNMFSGCTSLSNTSLKNILATLTTATNVTANKTLKYIGLTEAQATTCTGLSNWAAASAAGWTTGY